MRLSKSRRVFADQGEREIGAFGHRWGYACECGAKFNDIDIQYGRRGDGYCPACFHSDGFSEIKGPRVFKAIRRAKKTKLLYGDGSMKPEIYKKVLLTRIKQHLETAVKAFTDLESNNADICAFATFQAAIYNISHRADDIDTLHYEIEELEKKQASLELHCQSKAAEIKEQAS